jgi:SHS2 domain-containing protein
MRRFRFIDHTGDLGVVVRGNDLPQLFEHAAAAFFHVLTESRRIRPREAREILLEAPGLEELLVEWLGEFLYLFETEGLLFMTFEVHELDPHRIRAVARGETYEEGRHPIKTLIKAVTFHQLRIRQERGVWKAQIILDL